MNLLLVILLTLMTSCCAYHILIINSVPSKSHFNLINGFAEALVDGGHEVTLVTPNPGSKVKNRIKQIDASALNKILENVDHDINFSLLLKFNRDTGRTTIGTPEVRKALAEVQFDAVVTDWMYSDPADAGYAAVQRVPWILLTGAITEPFLEAMVDRAPLVPTGPVIYHFTKEPMNFWDRLINTFWQIRIHFQIYAAVQRVPWILLDGPVTEPYLEAMVDRARLMPTAPVMHHFTKEPMNFWHRIINTLWQVRIHYQMYQWHKIAEQDYKQTFGPIAKARGVTLPPFSEVKNNISVVFVNEYPPASQVKSLPPNMFQIGGYHISKNPPPMPKDIEEIMNSSKNGVILFSLGSWYHSTFLSNQTRGDLVELFGRLPYTVIWKYIETIENAPKNLHLRSWLPQQRILAHPKLKVFITHSGQLSTLECSHYGVPTISIPTFGDQFNNAHRSEQAGTGIKVDLTDNLVKDLEVALNKMLTDDSYKKQAMFYSGIFNNRPVEPSKLIVYHVDQAIRTKGSYHLRSSAALYEWYQLWMLDQVAFLLTILYTLYTLIKIATSKVLKHQSSKVKQN